MERDRNLDPAEPEISCTKRPHHAFATLSGESHCLGKDLQIEIQSHAHSRTSDCGFCWCTLLGHNGGKYFRPVVK